MESNVSAQINGSPYDKLSPSREATKDFAKSASTFGGLGPNWHGLSRDGKFFLKVELNHVCHDINDLLIASADAAERAFTKVEHDIEDHHLILGNKEHLQQHANRHAVHLKLKALKMYAEDMRRKMDYIAQQLGVDHGFFVGAKKQE